MTLVDYINDFITNDSYHNVVKNRTKKEGFIVHWEVLDRKVEPFTDEWRIKLCWERVGDEGAQRIVNLYLNGVPIKRIQEIFGLASPSCIYFILNAYGVKPNRMRKQSQRKVSSEELRKICELYRQGLSIYAIAKVLNRSTNLIYYYVKKKKVCEE